MDLSARTTIQQDPETVWRGLWDIEEVARCIQGCGDVEVLEPNERYAVVVKERVGPFSVNFKMELEVVEREENRHLAVEGRGMDSVLGTRVRWRADVNLESEGEAATAMDILLHAEIRGKIASLGEGMVKRKARESLEKFTASFAQMLEAGS